MTWRVKSRTTELLTLSRKSGCVSSSSVGTSSSSEPASPKYSDRKSFSAVLFSIGLERLANAASTSSSGRVVGLPSISYDLIRVLQVTYKSTNVFESSNGLASSISRSRSP